ncbi:MULTISPECIES: hypothetical protein [Shewanella]|uniref:hypothetical protein n=1 Tax=Shewanella TaxID=22 RepID=UPI00200D4AB8|nr:hypothetical protein [Shewanella dokdonensis]MCL1076490.1 hypothetical protein [Shewanella dokdonensis]
MIIDIVAKNMDVLLGNTKMRELVEQAQRQGIQIDYSYFIAMRKGTANPSIEKLENACKVLQMLPNRAWIEPWMLAVPDYFSRFDRDALKHGHVDADGFDAMMREILVTGHRLQFFPISEEQFDRVLELARYVFETKMGEKQLNLPEQKAGNE